MARNVTCKICKSKGNTDTFYKVTDEKGKNTYYCNKEEYNHFNEEKFKRENLIKYIAEDVFEYTEGQIVNPVLLKKIKEMHGFYDYEVIQECFKLNKENIQYWMNAKQFSNEYNMICYIMKIIEGNINDVYNKWKYKKQQEQKQESTIIDLDIINQTNVIINHTNNDNGITDFLNEEDI